MKKNLLLIPLQDIAREGETVLIDDQTLWSKILAGCDIEECEDPDRDSRDRRFEATLTLLATDGGVLVRGSVSGSLLLPCSRCAEPASVPITAEIDTFEALPCDTAHAADDDAANQEPDLAGETCIYLENGTALVDLSALLAQECVLSLPMTPLCDPDCKGLCPSCGQNLNTGQCSCSEQAQDPRLAVFRHMTITKRQNGKKS